MLCEEFEERLNEVLDERQRPEADELLAAHLSACGDCRQLAADYGLMLDGFYTLAARDYTPDVGPSVMVELCPPRVPRWRRVPLMATLLATAAGLLVAMVPLLRSPGDRTVTVVSPPLAPPNALASTNPSGSTKTLNSTAERPAGTVATIEPMVADTVVHQAEALETVSQLVPDLVPEMMAERDPRSKPYEELAKNTGKALATLVLFLPGVNSPMGIMDPDAESMVRDNAWAAEVTQSLKPVSETVAETLQLFLRVLPGAEERPSTSETL